jgi:hypothetical protein
MRQRSAIRPYCARRRYDAKVSALPVNRKLTRSAEEEPASAEQRQQTSGNAGLAARTIQETTPDFPF